MALADTASAIDNWIFIFFCGDVEWMRKIEWKSPLSSLSHFVHIVIGFECTTVPSRCFAFCVSFLQYFSCYFSLFFSLHLFRFVSIFSTLNSLCTTCIYQYDECTNDDCYVCVCVHEFCLAKETQNCRPLLSLDSFNWCIELYFLLVLEILQSFTELFFADGTAAVSAVASNK